MSALKPMLSGRLRTPTNAPEVGYLSFDSRSADLEGGCGAACVCSTVDAGVWVGWPWRGRHNRLPPDLAYRSRGSKGDFRIYLSLLFVVIPLGWVSGWICHHTKAPSNSGRNRGAFRTKPPSCSKKIKFRLLYNTTLARAIEGG